VKESIWEERVGKNTSVKGLGSHNKVEGRVYTKEGEGVKTLDLTVEYTFQLEAYI